MRRLLLRTWLAGSLAILGCKGTSAEQAYPNDPLLISQKPVEGKAASDRPVAVVMHEPRVPPVPSESTLVPQPAGPAQERKAIVAQPPGGDNPPRVVRACLHPPGPHQCTRTPRE
jgi:hypothetical protein